MTLDTGFNPVIHAPHRLRICAALESVDSAEFALLREVANVSESVLSKQLKVLEDAGYIKISKAKRDGRARTWVKLLPAGRTAYRQHVAALRAIVDGT